MKNSTLGKKFAAGVPVVSFFAQKERIPKGIRSFFLPCHMGAL